MLCCRRHIIRVKRRGLVVFTVKERGLAPRILNSHRFQHFPFSSIDFAVYETYRAVDAMVTRRLFIWMALARALVCAE